MQKNNLENRLEVGTSNIDLTVNFQWILALVSSICILFMFYPTIKNTINNFAIESSSHNFSTSHNKPVATNVSTGIAGTQNVSQIVTDALAFKAMLTTAQQTTLELTYSTTLARKWSNLPCGTSCRNGLQLGANLTSSQYAAAMLIIQDALSAKSNDGYDEFHQMNLAEAYLHANGGGAGYDSTLRWICFLNTPTATGAWMLQFGGHHYAANIAFNNGHVIGATPFFMGLEPKSFTYNSVAYDPLGDEKNALSAMLASLSSSELSTAFISSTFNDCVMIPGQTNGGASSFPAIAIGQPCSNLTSPQINLVLAAIQLYVSDLDSATANNVMAVYNSDIFQTYISYVGTGTSGNASSFLINQSNYVRISGPHVWIEFSCQGGVVIQGQIHYHTVWRDRSHDYGVDLTGAAIDASSVGVSEVNTSKMLNVYPNPSTSEINIDLQNAISNAKISVTDINGKAVYINENFSGVKIKINTETFVNGNYLLIARDNIHLYTAKFIKQ